MKNSSYVDITSITDIKIPIQTRTNENFIHSVSDYAI